MAEKPIFFAGKISRQIRLPKLCPLTVAAAAGVLLSGKNRLPPSGFGYCPGAALSRRRQPRSGWRSFSHFCI
jgi:hypothetical protein